MAIRFRKVISEMQGYAPGEQPQTEGYVKLNTNENPYPPSPRALSALRKASNHLLRLYPEPLGDTLRAVAAETYGLSADQILAGNGSDELLSILVRCFVGPGDRVLYAVPTYTLYDTLVAIQDGEKVTVDFPEDFSLPESFSSRDAALVFLCNPNSPSGTLAPLSQIEELARRAAGILIVDEAYIDFAEGQDASAIALIQKLPNVVVLRSFSKSFSLAGMRIGLAFASRDIMTAMIKVKDSYNVNRLSLIAATEALRDLSWMTRNVKRIQNSRRALTRGLQAMGFTVYPSEANFVLARRPGKNLRGLYEELKRRKILVRYFDLPRLQDSLRITVGRPDEIKTLLKEVAAIG